MGVGVTLIKDLRFVFGAMLCFASAFVIGAFHVGVVFLFGIPVVLLVVGIVFLLLSKAAKLAKSVVLLVTIAIIPSTFAVTMYLRTAEPEVFLIPQHHRGEIVVFLDEPCGGEPVLENGSRIYSIGDDGVLITRSKKNDGYLNRKFFSLTAEGDRKPIPEFQRQDLDTEKKEWELFGQPIPVESFSPETVGVFWAYGSKTYQISRNSISYVVGSYNDRKRDSKTREHELNKFAERADKLLQECREK